MYLGENVMKYQVIVGEEGIHSRWKAYFGDLLQEDTQD